MPDRPVVEHVTAVIPIDQSDGRTALTRIDGTIIGPHSIARPEFVTDPPPARDTDVDDTCHGRCSLLLDWFTHHTRGFLVPEEAHEVLDMLLNRLVGPQPSAPPPVTWDDIPFAELDLSTVDDGPFPPGTMDGIRAAQAQARAVNERWADLYATEHVGDTIRIVRPERDPDRLCACSHPVRGHDAGRCSHRPCGCREVH